MNIIEGGVCSAKGFLAAAAAAGIKYQSRDDMAMIFSEAPCEVAGTFTTNVVKAAPVIWDRDIVESGRTVRAAVVNSGIANACTGAEGREICDATAEAAACVLQCEKEEVLLGSTGVIGMQIPLEKIVAGVEALAPKLDRSPEAGLSAERAIMTTDTVPKQACVTFEAAGNDGGTVTVTVGGMTKGSGMIHPNMCTMLAYVTTDCAITKEMLTKATKAAIDDSFNMVSVDGDTSTNDTFLVLANGLAGNAVIDREGPDFTAFCEALHAVCMSLARQMAADGEGATALMEVTVKNAADVKSAKILAKSVVGSLLTKAAVYGHDANWGRILCALGYAGVDFDPENVDLYLTSAAGEAHIFSHGSACDYSEEQATAILSEPEVTITADMHQGEAEATAWGCDLTHEYVNINADYRS